jgi:Tfp pilus assembly protein PilF
MLGDHQAAERSLRKAREELGDTAALLNNLGSVLLVLGNYKEALPLLKAAQEKDPSADTALSLAIAYESSGEVRQAKDWYLKARSLGAKGEELEQRISILESELSEKH